MNKETTITAADMRDQTPAELFRSAVERSGFTVVDDVPDDLTTEQLTGLLEELLRQVRAYAEEATA